MSVASAFFSSGSAPPPAAPLVSSLYSGSPPGFSPPASQQLGSAAPPLPHRLPPRLAAPAPAAGPLLPQAPAAALAVPWRPPATRRFLWDRTPQGPALALDLGVSVVVLRSFLCSLQWNLEIYTPRFSMR